MLLCERNHEEICYEIFGKCPLCEALKEIEDLKEQLADAVAELNQ